MVGWRHMLTHGVYFPHFRGVFTLGNDREKILCDYVNERLKLACGLNVNEEQWEEYGRMGISSDDLSFRHYAIVVVEYLLRLIYVGIFVMLLGACIVLSVKTRCKECISCILAAHFVFVLCVAGFIQTLPRHTTVLVPISVYAVIVLIRNPTREKVG